MIPDISRERIRSRLIKNASQLWGVQASDVNAFDPIVNMMFSAFAAEMEKIYHEIESSHSRVLERLSKLLVPEVNKGPLPAHGVIHAGANEPRTVIGSNTQFYFQKRIPSKESSMRETFRDLYFTPVADTTLFNGDIQYLAFGRSMYSNTDSIHKERVAEGRGSRKIESNAVWVGLDLNDRLDSIKDLSFYFDWITSAERAYFSKFLSSTKWTLSGVDLDIVQGLPLVSNEDIQDFLDPEIEFDPARNVARDVLNFYKERFVTVSLPSGFTGGLHTLSTRLPEELKQIFNEQEVSFIQKKLFWIKIVFPGSLSGEVIENLSCSINSFPVINRRFNEFTYRLQPQFNIIPLGADADHFFSIQGVKTTDGSQYNSSSLADTHKIAPGTYVLRRGGIERFDTRNAGELLTYMVELLRDESAAFAIYGHESLTADLKGLNQTLNVISQTLDKHSDGQDPVNYLVVRSKSRNDVIFIEFWSTAGEFGNNQKIGTRLSLNSGANVNGENIVLLTNTIGGRDSLSDSETLNYFKNALLSRNRIVSEADIKYVCTRELGSLISDVKVEKGLEVDDKSYSGFKRTIDVVLYPANELNPTLLEWRDLCRNLQIKLEASATALTPLRVKLSSTVNIPANGYK